MKFLEFKIVKECVGICVLALIAGLIINYFHPGGFEMIPRSVLKYKKIVSISELEAKIKFDAGIGLFVDARNDAEYKEGHIKGAIHFPVYPKAVSRKKINNNKKLQEPRELIVYCTSSTCGASRDLAEMLIDKGYSRTIYIIKNGFPGWVERKYPVEK